MKTCLICPSERVAVSALAQTAPLSNLPILGKSLLEYWLEHMAGLGAKQVYVLAADRPGMVCELVGNGARWGLNVEVLAEVQELTPDLVRSKYPITKADWLPEPCDVVLMDHFPGQPEHPLLASYAGWFSAVLAWLPTAATMNRIGVRELQPGVWAAMHTHIAGTAQLKAPCWIGEGVRIGPRSVIGPMAILENHVFVESDSEITNAVVGPETLVGKFTGLNDTLARGGTVIDLKTGSVASVNDPFLISALDNPLLPHRASDWLRQLAAVITRDHEDFELLWKDQRMKLP